MKISFVILGCDAATELLEPHVNEDSSSPADVGSESNGNSSTEYKTLTPERIEVKPFKKGGSYQKLTLTKTRFVGALRALPRLLRLHRKICSFQISAKIAIKSQGFELE